MDAGTPKGQENDSTNLVSNYICTNSIRII